MSDQKIVSLCKGLPKNLSYNGKDFLSGIGKDEASELVV
ncbi:MOSC domain-containing protein, partial [Mesorhizobium sp. M00.F.Ca.ET.186.01.1.1]